MISPVSFPPHQISVVNPNDDQKAILEPLLAAYEAAIEKEDMETADKISGLIWNLNNAWGLIHD